MSTKHTPDDELHERGEPIPNSGRAIDPAKLIESTEDDEPLVSLGDVLADAFNLMDRRAEGREKPITTPWSDFNEQLPGGGFWPGCHVLVSGTGVGKTTFAKQIILHVAKEGIPCACVGLEIDKAQSALRIAGDHAQVSWSKAYTGQASENERRKLHETAPELSKLPIYLEAGTAMGWSASKLHTLARRVRKKHPEGPMLIVVDYLQLIGPEPNAERRQDLRERIGQAAYQARMVAASMGVTVLLISSVARESYSKVNGLDALKAAAVEIDEVLGQEAVLDRFMRAPEVLIGLGKESGEIEFAADTVTAAISLAGLKKKDKRAVVFAIAKLRTGAAGWCSLLYNGFRFENDPTHGRSITNELKKKSATQSNGETKSSATQNRGEA